MIVDLYLEKNSNAITETKIKYGKKIYVLSHNIVHDVHYAEECEADTYLKTWQSIPPASPKNYFYAFIAKIARNISLNLYAKQHAKKRSAVMIELSTELEQCLPSSDTMNLKDREFASYINDFLAKLSSDERNVFVRRYWHCDTISEIALANLFTQSKVKSMLMRTRQKLKIYLEKGDKL